MAMGWHAAPIVRRAPSISAFVLALVALIVSHAGVSAFDVDNSTASLLKFKSALTHTEALTNWQSSTNPCTGNWVGVLCSGGQVVGLQLENMQLSGQIDVDSLLSLPMLRSLNFINNDFYGRMPDWKKLGALQSLSFSNNHFSGEIPADTFQGMQNLKKVNMANNEFKGPIPSSLLSSPSLTELKIENNQFGGPIPNLPVGITSFNASNNQLDGRIPPSVAKMDPSSFSGNKDLCGKPLKGRCAGDPDEDIAESPAPDSSPSSSPPPPADAAPKPKTSALKIVMTIIAILVALALIVLILLAYLRSKNKKKRNGILAPTGYHQTNRSPHQSRQVVEALPAAVVSKAPKTTETGQMSFVREDRERFDLQDLLRASAEVLGSGNFGSSYKAVLMDGQAVVVKRCKQMNNVDKEDFDEHMKRIGKLQHPNLLPLVAYYYRKEEKLLVFDHVENGSLAGTLHGKHSVNKPSLDWPKRLKIVKGVAKALYYLQSELPNLTVAHGHLKSSNVLLDKDFNPLLMDYSLIPVVNIEQVNRLLVSYKSPEYTQSGRVTKRTDVWCLGILILEILTGNIPVNYVVAQGAGYDSFLAGWVKSMVSGKDGDVFDPEMGNTNNSRGEMEKLLSIGAACCVEDWQQRLDLKQALEKIEQVKEN
ncbi:transmembrane signal receptor [Lithospermum erythrorhizon]|uniref:Transmembrane signal receptor n=1 Tax=Lithospermum erythrorhizon TaxID=34254 RepID=A0AAV3RP23_LITER